MDLLQLSILLVIAGICAAIAQWVVGFSPGGFIMSIIIGVVGAYLGMSLASLLPLPLILPIHVGTVSVADLRSHDRRPLPDLDVVTGVVAPPAFGSGTPLSARR